MIHLTKHLLKNQQDVFVTVLGLNGNGALNFTEAGEKLGRNKEHVSKIFANSCSRLKKLIEKGTINPDFFPRLMMVSIPGGKKASQPLPANANHVFKEQSKRTEQNLR